MSSGLKEGDFKLGMALLSNCGVFKDCISCTLAF